MNDTVNNSLIEDQPSLASETEEPTAEARTAKERILGFVVGLLGVFAKISFFVTTQGGFTLYVYFSASLIISPYFALVTGLGLNDFLLVVAAILTLIVMTPMFELMITLPFGIYKEIYTGTRGMSPMSPLHWTLEILELSVKLINGGRTGLGVLVLFVSACVVVFLMTLVIKFFSSSPPWTLYVMSAFVVVPTMWATFNMGILMFKAWLYLVRKDKMTNEPEDPKRARWPFVRHWEKFLDDAQASPIDFSKRDRLFVVHVVFIGMFVLLEVLNIVIVCQRFHGVFLTSIILNIVCFPFVIRFNILKRFICKESLERHQTFKKMCGYFTMVFMIISIQFVVQIIQAMSAKPPETPRWYSNTTYGDLPSINKSQAFSMPSYCYLGGDTMIRSVGTAELPNDFVGGEKFWRKKMELLYGANWTNDYTFIDGRQYKHLTLVNIHDHKLGVEYLVIGGTGSRSDALLAYSVGSLYLIPETIFNMIPFADVVFTPLLELFMPIFHLPFFCYTPTAILQEYSNEVGPYIAEKMKQNSNRHVIFIGYSIGGTIVKVYGIKYQTKAFAINSPEIRIWYAGQLSKSAVIASYVNNLLIPQQKYVGSEQGGTANYVPYDMFPQNPASLPATLCTMAVQCRILDHFEEYCSATLGSDVMQQIIDGSAYK